MTSFVLIDRTSRTITNRIWGSLRSSNHPLLLIWEKDLMRRMG